MKDRNERESHQGQIGAWRKGKNQSAPDLFGYPHDRINYIHDEMKYYLSISMQYSRLSIQMTYKGDGAMSHFDSLSHKVDKGISMIQSDIEKTKPYSDLFKKDFNLERMQGSSIDVCYLGYTGSLSYQKEKIEAVISLMCDFLESSGELLKDIKQEIQLMCDQNNANRLALTEELYFYPTITYQNIMTTHKSAGIYSRYIDDRIMNCIITFVSERNLYAAILWSLVVDHESKDYSKALELSKSLLLLLTTDSTIDAKTETKFPSFWDENKSWSYNQILCFVQLKIAMLAEKEKRVNKNEELILAFKFLASLSGDSGFELINNTPNMLIERMISQAEQIGNQKQEINALKQKILSLENAKQTPRPSSFWSKPAVSPTQEPPKDSRLKRRNSF